MTSNPNPSFNFADLFDVVARAVPDRPVVVCGEESLTYAELNERASALAGYLHASGIKRGDNVGLQLANGPAYLEAFIAASKIGAVPFNINYRYVKAELKYLYENSDAAAIFFNSSLADDVLPVAAEVDSIKVLLTVGEELDVDDSRVKSYEAAIAEGLSEPDPSERRDDDLLIIYTGGTTGAPKGVMWPHKSLFFGALGGGGFYHPKGPVTKPEELTERVLETPWVKTLPLAPLMHGAALWTAISSLFSGHTIVLNPDTRFDAGKIWDMAVREGVNIMAIVGDAMAAPLIDALEENPGKWNLAALSYIGSGGAIFSEHLQERFRKVLDSITIASSLGATETGVMGPGNRETDEGIMRYDPRPDLAVLVDAERLAEPGELGVVARRGLVPVGYYGDPEKSAATFVSIDGVDYALGGDAARLEEDGSITVLGRGSTCINTGGEKVYPEEVEQVLKSHPAVVDAMVVGVPHPRWTQMVAAVVALRDGSETDIEALQEHCRSELAGYKVPREIRFEPELQRSAVGKPDYAWAKERLTA
ncbi:MAG: acyl-CoA synthetase [Gammaproteobacteria bacterium]|nr:acyl-CoA synthetase [Gammaproteobacteria bacterium]